MHFIKNAIILVNLNLKHKILQVNDSHKNDVD